MREWQLPPLPPSRRGRYAGFQEGLSPGALEPSCLTPIQQNPILPSEVRRWAICFLGHQRSGLALTRSDCSACYSQNQATCRPLCNSFQSSRDFAPSVLDYLSPRCKRLRGPEGLVCFPRMLVHFLRPLCGVWGPR